MSRSCERRDADLLMLAHGELDRGSALRVRAHMAICPRCRVRLRQMEGLTASLANAMSNPRLGVRTFRRVPRSAWASVGLLAILLSVLGGLAARDVAAAAPASSTSTADSCRASAVGSACPRSKPFGPLKTAAPKGKPAATKPNLPTTRCDKRL